MRNVGCPREAGIALLELMIGLFIGLLTTLAISQVLSRAESQRRATMSGSDAQVSGTLALHALQRDIKQAGYGIANNPAALGCPLNGDSYNKVALPDALVPFVISNAAGSHGEDVVSVFLSTKQGAAVPLLVTADHPASDAGKGANYFVVKSAFSANAGDYLVAVPESWVAGSAECTLFKVSGIYSGAGAACTAGGGVACTRVAHDAAAFGYFPSAGYAAKSYLLNLGATIRYRTYAVSDSMLRVSELGGAAKDAFPEIVNLQAYYAKDTDGDGVVDTYDTETPSTVAGWAQVLGARVAVVARSAQFEKTEVTSSNPEWNLGSVAKITDSTATIQSCSDGSGGKCAVLKVDYLTDYTHYRYKVFDTMIPLRNALWNS